MNLHRICECYWTALKYMVRSLDCSMCGVPCIATVYLVLSSRQLLLVDIKVSGRKGTYAMRHLVFLMTFPFAMPGA